MRYIYKYFQDYLFNFKYIDEERKKKKHKYLFKETYDPDFHEQKKGHVKQIYMI